MLSHKDDLFSSRLKYLVLRFTFTPLIHLELISFLSVKWSFLIPPCGSPIAQSFLLNGPAFLPGDLQWYHGYPSNLLGAQISFQAPFSARWSNITL